MRVIALENSKTRTLGLITVIKGSIYNVIEVLGPRPDIRTYNGSNIWYKLLETGNDSWHSSTIFREIDDISEEVEEFETESIL